MDKSTPRPLKFCTCCNSDRPLDDFNQNKKSLDGLRHHCRPCEIQRRRDYRAANLERERARDRALAKAKYDADPEKYRAKSRAYYRADPQKQLAYRKAWDQAHPEEAAEKNRQWRLNNPEKARAKQARRYARRRGATVGEVDLSALPAGTCGLCDEVIDHSVLYPDPLSKSIDHIIPIFLGGLHEQSNLQWTHLRCNLRKGARLIG